MAAGMRWLCACSALVLCPAEEPTGTLLAGPYAALERMDMRRVLMRVAKEEPLPPAGEEVMLDQLEQWKWTVEMSGAGAAVLVTASQCPHGLGLIPSTLSWQGGGQWRHWPGTFEHSSGPLVAATVKWAPISASRACQGAAGVRQLGKELQEIKDGATCQKACAERAGCRAIDYYAKTKWCLLYDRPCDSPDKTHDGASSHKLEVVVAKGAALGQGEHSFFDAKRLCQEMDACGGFSYAGLWPDKERMAGEPRLVYFSKESKTQQASGPQKWHSYILKDNPRANCNPEGRQFECPANPYACLGLSIDADDAAIKQAYRSLSKRLHPDKIKASTRTTAAVQQAEQAFRDISESHETLRDPQLRRKADMHLRRERKNWEEQKASVQDIYIKEPLVTSLEPESYTTLIPHGREWLVHFFLPENDECKQMKIAISRAAGNLGTGEGERGLPTPRLESRGFFRPGDIFRGVIREKSIALRTEGATQAEGDVHIALLVLPDDKATLYAVGEEKSMVVDFKVQEGRPVFSMSGAGRTWSGTFDKRQSSWLRGTIAEDSDLKKSVASFALQKDLWMPAKNLTQPPGSRHKPRLFGAVNCGRFPDFCKRKGADPSVAKRFPQVRMLFPEETRFEIYRGRVLGREVTAFTLETSRTAGVVRILNTTTLQQLQVDTPSTWLVLLQQEVPSKSALDCALCKSVLPALQRTAPRLAEAGVNAGVVNCTAEPEACSILSGGDEGEEGARDVWGTFRLFAFGGQKAPSAPPGGEAPLFAEPELSLPLWDRRVMVGEPSQAVLLAAFDSAVAMAKVREAGRPQAAGKSRDEL